MLLMIRAKATVIRTSPADGSVVSVRLLRRFQKDLSALAVVADVVSDQHALGSVLWAALQHQHLVILKHYLAFNLSKDFGAERNDNVVKEIGAATAAHAGLPINNDLRRCRIEEIVGVHQSIPASAAHCRTSRLSARGASFKNSNINRAPK